MEQGYDENCELDLDEIALNRHKEILKIVEKNCSKIILTIPIEKVKSEEERHQEEKEIRNCLVFRELEPFFLESKLCRKYGTLIKRKKGKKGYTMTDNWYFYKCNKESVKILKSYPNLFDYADWK